MKVFKRHPSETKVFKDFLMVGNFVPKDGSPTSNAQGRFSQKKFKPSENLTEGPFQSELVTAG